MEITKNTDVLIKQEDELQFINFGGDDALRLGLLIINIAKDEIKKGVAVHIENDKHPLFTCYMDGTTDNNLYWVNTKKNVVKKYEHSSLYIGEIYKNQGTTFHKETNLSDAEYQAEGGSFPLIIKGQGRIGTVTVSGLTGEEDHALAVEGIRRFLQG
ncbi:MAG: hypothetical protein K0S41_999 [Anaerocolumna sp.]|jgi:uncharacterized protein (UPF0303 family)|nr:hypothetical protein [Anaerocolumna sp.]